MDFTKILVQPLFKNLTAFWSTVEKVEPFYYAGDKTKVVFLIKGHYNVSKAFSRSRNRSSLGMFFSLTKEMILSKSRMFSPIHLPFMKPV